MNKFGAIRICFVLRSFVMAILITLVFSAELHAQGNIMILPRRVVFEGSLKSQEITLANTGNDSAKYLVSIVQMRMKDDGSFENITAPDSGQYFADKYLRFYPRTVTIAPKKSQIIKMQFVKSSKMAPGEYRSHIYFRAVPKVKPLGENTVVTDSTPVTARLVPVFGITIPVIIRIGEANGKVTISDLSFEIAKDTLPQLKMKFNRTGSFSVYGDLTVTHISDQGVETKVAFARGIAVYTPNLFRRFQCEFDKVDGIDYKKGKLHVVFTTPVDTKPQRLAEAEYILK